MLSPEEILPFIEEGHAVSEVLRAGYGGYDQRSVNLCLLVVKRLREAKATRECLAERGIPRPIQQVVISYHCNEANLRQFVENNPGAVGSAIEKDVGFDSFLAEGYGPILLIGLPCLALYGILRVTGVTLVSAICIATSFCCASSMLCCKCWYHRLKSAGDF